MDVKEELLRTELEQLPQKFYRQILTLLPEAVLMIIGRKIVFANQAACQLFGQPLHLLVDHHYTRYVPRSAQAEIMQHFRRVKEGNNQFPRITFDLQRLDRMVPVSLQAAIAKAADGPLVYIVTLRDITLEAELSDAIKQREARLRYLAEHDHLTQLLNRKGFHDHMAKAIARAQRQKAEFAVLYIDLDNFKQVNDRYGHTVGDELLVNFARRLKDCFRTSDIVARVGGDEFVVILDHINPDVSDDELLANIRAKVLTPLSCSFGPHQLEASTGISRFPQDGVDEATLIEAADQRMYQAKANQS